MTTVSKSELAIYECVSPKPPAYRRFRVIETYLSLDGYRTRCSDKAFATFEEAEHFVKEAEK